MSWSRGSAAAPALLASVLAAAVAVGCTATTERGTPYTIKMDRELQAYVNADLPTTHAAAKKVLEEEFLFMIVSDSLDGREGIIEARSAKDRQVRVETYAHEPDSTRLEIFVTPFGYQEMQLDILGSIEEELAPTDS